MDVLVVDDLLDRGQRDGGARAQVAAQRRCGHAREGLVDVLDCPDVLLRELVGASKVVELDRFFGSRRGSGA